MYARTMVLMCASCVQKCASVCDVVSLQVLDMLRFIQGSVWPYLFGKSAEELQQGAAVRADMTYSHSSTQATQRKPNSQHCPACHAVVTAAASSMLCNDERTCFRSPRVATHQCPQGLRHVTLHILCSNLLAPVYPYLPWCAVSLRLMTST